MIPVGSKAVVKAAQVISILGESWKFCVAPDPSHSWIGVFVRKLPDDEGSIQISVRPSDLKDIDAETLAARIQRYAQQPRKP